MQTIDLMAELETKIIQRTETPSGASYGYFVSEDEMIQIRKKLRENLNERQSNAK